MKDPTWHGLYLPALSHLLFHTMSQCKMASMDQGCKVSRTSTSRIEAPESPSQLQRRRRCPELDHTRAVAGLCEPTWRDRSSTGGLPDIGPKPDFTISHRIIGEGYPQVRLECLHTLCEQTSLGRQARTCSAEGRLQVPWILLQLPNKQRELTFKSGLPDLILWYTSLQSPDLCNIVVDTRVLSTRWRQKNPVDDES